MWQHAGRGNTNRKGVDLMAVWMGIADFLQEVDQLARTWSQDAKAAPVRPHPGNPERTRLDADRWTSAYGELSEFTTQLLQTARPNAYDAADSPRVQVLGVKLERFHTRGLFLANELATVAKLVP